MRRTILLLPLLLGIHAAPLAAQTADSGQPSTQNVHPQRRPHDGMFLKRLNLSDAQQQQVRTIFQANRSAHRAAKLRILTAEKDLQAAISEDPSNEAAIRSRASTVESARAEAAVQRARVRAQIVAILTPEQKQMLAQEDQRRQQRLQKRIDSLNQQGS